MVVGTVQTPGCQIDLIESLIFNKGINDNENVDVVDVGVDVDVNDNEDVDVVDVGVSVDVDDNEDIDGVFDLT